jgi:flavin reductase (DIM6/NTAB) family NADH-FMN oxidoreductase RutF
LATIEELKHLTTGIFVLTVQDGDVRHGMSSSWVTQVSGEPPLVMAAIDRDHYSHDAVRRARRFGLNVVGRRGKALEDHFYSAAARGRNNLGPFAVEETPSGVPLLVDAMVSFECAVESEHRAGDHTLFVASVASVRNRATDVPLTSQDLEYVYLGTGKIVKR